MNVLESFKDKNKFIFLIMISLLVCVFRLPILASVKLHSLTMLLDIIPIILIFVGGYLFKKSKPSSHLLTFATFYAIIYTFIYALVTAIETSKGLVVARELSAISIFLAFPLIADLILTKEEIENMLFDLFRYFLIIAFALTFFEFMSIKLGFYTVDEIALWLNDRWLEKILRINTFLGLGAFSSILECSGIIYLTHAYLSRSVPAGRKATYLPLIIVLGILTVLISDSLTSVLALAIGFFTIALAFIKPIKIKNFSFKKISIALVVLIVVTFIGHWLLVKSGLKHRFFAYYEYGELDHALAVYFPRFDECDIMTVITGFPVLYNYAVPIGCQAGELHGFILGFKHGFFTQIGWWVFILIPVIFFFKNIRFYSKLPASFFAAAVFLYGMIHYSGIEIWGINYIFSLMVVVCLKFNPKSN